MQSASLQWEYGCGGELCKNPNRKGLRSLDEAYTAKRFVERDPMQTGRVIYFVEFILPLEG
jgi:hypothetical protein